MILDRHNQHFLLVHNVARRFGPHRISYIKSPKRQKSIDDYFKGGGRIPSWAAGISIFGTVLSPITFLAIPAKTYSTDWLYFIFNITIFLVAPIIIYLFIPFYRKLNITTAYEYLEKRFNVYIRLIGSICFIIYQITYCT